MAEYDFSGVYVIRNHLDGRVYVGSTSRQISTRWYEHRKLLKKGTHHSIHLQRSWTKYGSKVFLFEVLERCEDRITEREQFWINSLKSFEREYGYNLCPQARGNKGRFFSLETRSKIAKAHTGKRHSKETIAKMSASRMGRVFSEETRNKISEANRRRKRLPMSDERKAIQSANSLGRRHTDAARLKISSAAKLREEKKRALVSVRTLPRHERQAQAGE